MQDPVASALEGSSGSSEFWVPLIIGVALIPALLWLWSLIDSLSWPRTTWEAAGLSRARWVMRISLLGIIGTVLYLRVARQDLKAAYASIRWRD